MTLDMAFNEASVLFVLGITILAFWRRDIPLYIVAIVTDLLAGAAWIETSLAYGVPAFLLAVYLVLKLFMFAVTRRI